MKLLPSLLLASALVATSSTPLRAQPSSGMSSAEQQKMEEVFTRNVKNAVFASCNKTASIKDSRERADACKCYSNAYVNRYPAQELFSINQWADKNQGGRGIVVLMMSPERRSCKIP